MSISERVYIRWIPDEAAEPTSTLVLTAHTRQFVDLRLLLPAPLTALDWGFAGRSVGTPEHGVWEHMVDSRSTHPAAEPPDEGDLRPHPTMADVELESGRMRHPESGEVREYEEAWRAVEVHGVPGEERCVSVVLEVGLGEGAEGAGAKGMVVRVGQYCQGIVRIGSEVTVERWAWSDEVGKWICVARIGSAALPCAATWMASPKEGERIEYGGFTWNVSAVKTW